MTRSRPCAPGNRVCELGVGRQRLRACCCFLYITPVRIGLHAVHHSWVWTSKGPAAPGRLWQPCAPDQAVSQHLLVENK
jgi:hypothetical protein